MLVDDICAAVAVIHCEGAITLEKKLVNRIPSSEKKDAGRLEGGDREVIPSPRNQPLCRHPPMPSASWTIAQDTPSIPGRTH